MYTKEIPENNSEDQSSNQKIMNYFKLGARVCASPKWMVLLRGDVTGYVTRSTESKPPGSITHLKVKNIEGGRFYFGDNMTIPNEWDVDYVELASKVPIPTISIADILSQSQK